jgi:hypothetical protein
MTSQTMDAMHFIFQRYINFFVSTATTCIYLSKHGPHACVTEARPFERHGVVNVREVKGGLVIACVLFGENDDEG